MDQPNYPVTVVRHVLYRTLATPRTVRVTEQGTYFLDLVLRKKNMLLPKTRESTLFLKRKSVLLVLLIFFLEYRADIVALAPPFFEDPHGEWFKCTVPTWRS